MGEKSTSVIEKCTHEWRNVAYKVHIQRTHLEYRATIHCWKALDEIYEIYIFLHFSSRKHSSNINLGSISEMQTVCPFKFRRDVRFSNDLFSDSLSDFLENSEKCCSSYFSTFLDFNLNFIVILRRSIQFSIECSTSFFFQFLARRDPPPPAREFQPATGQCGVPKLREGARYVHAAAAMTHTILVKDDGAAAASSDPLQRREREREEIFDFLYPLAATCSQLLFKRRKFLKSFIE